MSDVPANHPRAQSLQLRELIAVHSRSGLVAETGSIAHGRGEAFDYLLGEVTPPSVHQDIQVAAAVMLEAKRPVISVNGNAAALAPRALVELGAALGAPLEVNIFYGRTEERERLIAAHLRSHGASNVLGVSPTAKVTNLTSSRALVDRDGIFKADVVLVTLEDGDRTAALLESGKKVISIDLNPFSRTARDATLNICDNLVRALPLLTTAAHALSADWENRQALLKSLDKRHSFRLVVGYIADRLKSVAESSLV